MTDRGEIPKRRLGKTGEVVSIIGLGGSHIGYDTMSDAQSVDLIRSAIDSGITFMDNNWGYHGGRSEERMGHALRNGYRDKVFLMTKVDARDRKGALKQLDESLKRLQTDRVDLWQIHEVVYHNDPELLSAPGGAIEALDEAKRAGKTRFVGFTGHKHPSLHLQMLDLYPFDASQMPLNVMDHHYMSFETEVLPVMLERDVGVIGMKSMGDPYVLKSGVVDAKEALSYVLSLPVATVVVGMDKADVLSENVEVARGFSPLSKEEIDAILLRTALTDVSGDGRYELYKTSKQYDADIGRKTHGFPTIEEMAM